MKIPAIKIIISLAVLATSVAAAMYAYTKLIDRLEQIRSEAIAERDAIWERQLADVQKVVQIAVSAGKDTVRAELAVEVQEAENRARTAQAALDREKEQNIALQEALRINLPADYIIGLCGETPIAECFPADNTN